MKHTAFFLAFVAAGAAVAGSWQALVSPAPLSPGHQAFEGDCDKCHLVFSGVPNEKCLACHEEIATRQTARTGYHGDVRSQSCQACHVDHQGKNGTHTAANASAAFDHAKTAFDLSGAHGKAKCVECHKPAAAGARKQIPSAACATCHTDEHTGTLGSRCAACHVATGWKDQIKKISAHETATDGGHAGLTCKECHAGGRQLEKPGRCINCHQTKDAHGGIAVSCEECHQVAAFKPAQHNHDTCTCAFPGKHQTFACLACHQDYKFTNTPTLCSGCHDAQRKHEPLGECSRCHTALSWKENRFDHNAPRSKFLLEVKHLEVACNQCHTNTDKKGRTVFRAAPADCLSCHKKLGDDTHGDFGDCARCHSTKGFSPSTFDHAASARFPLTGKHAKASCRSCHEKKTQGYPSAKAARAPGVGETTFAVWGRLGANHGVVLAATAAQTAPAPPADAAPHGGDPALAGVACVHCHEDEHKGQVGTACASCHTPDAWTPSTFTAERHARTAFALDGKHAVASCKGCHVSGKLKGLPNECAGCHVDVHEGKLGASCQACHSTKGFSPVDRFDHGLTGFVLSKPHSSVACAKCHGEKREKDLRAVKGAQDCAACHTPAHGAFRAACTDCHVATDEKLKTASGAQRDDHRATGFLLERRHAVVACKSCHVANKPTPLARCQSCHAEPHGGNAGIDCADCHRPDRWSLVRFDHDRTGWTLRGRHFLTPCNACHTNQTWIGLRSECFDCHARDAARAKKAVGGHAFGPTDCRDCHRSGWRW